MPLGSASLNGGGFDPAGLALTGYWREFAGAPWISKCGTYSLVNNVSNATIGAAVNGAFTPASMIISPTATGLIGSAGSTANKFFNNTAGAGWTLVKFNGFGSISNSQLISFNSSDGQSASNFTVAVTSGGSARAQFTGISANINTATEPSALTTGIWYLIQFAFNQNAVSFRVNSNAWVTTAVAVAPDPMNTSDTLLIGIGDSAGNAAASSAGFNGLMLEMAVTNYVIDFPTFDQIRAYCNGKYAVSV